MHILMLYTLFETSVKIVLQMVNLNPMMWNSKNQATSEIDMCRAKFLVTQTYMEQMMDLQNRFWYLGVPVYKTCYMWEGNKSQIYSSSVPYARLCERHNNLPFHYVRSLMATGFVSLSHIPSAFNVADTLSKHWNHELNYHHLIWFLFTLFPWTKVKCIIWRIKCY